MSAKARNTSPVNRLWQWLLPVQLIIGLAVISFAVGVLGTMSLYVLRGRFDSPVVTLSSGGMAAPVHVSGPRPNAISSIFTSEVRFWEPQILRWSRQYDVDPNMLATVIQIESCGDWQAGSSAGAQGLFQVMPFHFQPSEDPKDPETNARAGIAYLKDSLTYAEGHFGLALAGYNGGHGVIDRGWGRWASETRRYYLWGTAMYIDALNNRPTSAALQDWLAAGGSILCTQAAVRQQATPVPVPASPVILAP
jgi:hypothetical protein